MIMVQNFYIGDHTQKYEQAGQRLRSSWDITDVLCMNGVDYEQDGRYQSKVAIVKKEMNEPEDA